MAYSKEFESTIELAKENGTDKVVIFTDSLNACILLKKDFLIIIWLLQFLI